MNFKVLGSALIALCIAACGSNTTTGSGGTSADRPDHVIQPYEAVPIYATHGPGAPVQITGARLVAEGRLQVLVDGFSCGVPTKVVSDEKPDSVTVEVFAASYAEGDCPADIVPWFVTVDLKAPLGNRDLLDAGHDKLVEVVDCVKEPKHLWCAS